MPLRSANKNFFLEQWNRVKRWKCRCDKKPDLDFYEAFFINAYHLKDWLEQWYEKNPSYASSASILNTAFSEKVYLKILKDICNGSKHFTLHKKPAISRQYVIVNEYVSENTGRKVVLIGCNKYPLVDLANDIYNYWENYLTDSKLIKLKNEISGPLIP